MVCDDVDAMRELLRAIMNDKEAYDVVGEARDGNEAVSEAERLQPHVILLDLAMPNRTGLDALPDIRRVAPDASVIVLSGFASPAVIAEVFECGATHYLKKGSDPETILALIAECRYGVEAKAD